MAAGPWTLYRNGRSKLVTGIIDLDTSVLRCRIFKAQAAASVSVATLSLLSQIGTTNRAANMPDMTLSNVSISAIAGSATAGFFSDNLVVPASGGDATSLMYAVVYNSLSAGGGHLLMWNKMSTAAFNVTSGNDLTINTPANGFFVFY